MSSKYPLRHLSIRVPWHDAGWNGTICKAPQLNGACVKLTNIAAQKREKYEKDNAGKLLKDLNQNNYPPCIDESAAFMADYDISRVKNHPNQWSDYHKHLKPTEQHYPRYSAPVVPFRWMMKDELDGFQENLNIDVDLRREPDLPYSTNWINEAKNQKALLDGFKDHLQKDNSLCFFYARYVPFVERTDNRRILIGVGKVTAVGDLTKYEGDSINSGSWIWERPIQHSIRTDETSDGFLMPYQEIINRAQIDSSINLEDYIAFTPPEQKGEFSYRSELVTHDGAIAALLSMEDKLKLIHKHYKKLKIDTMNQQQWIHDRLADLWKLRGPFPGLGAVLCAFGFSRGMFIAHKLQERAGENEDPWPQVSEMFNNPQIIPSELQYEIQDLKLHWERTKSDVLRYKFLRLLSCFQLSIEQAKAISNRSAREKNKWDVTESQILENPYRIFEVSHNSEEEIHFLTIDKGIFRGGNTQNNNPLIPPELSTPRNIHRVRAFAVASLEKAASEGHTLQSSSDLANSINNFEANPKCETPPEFIESYSDKMAPTIVTFKQKDDQMLQLERYGKIRELIRNNVLHRLDGARHRVSQDWSRRLTNEFGSPKNEEQKQARKEQVRALTELAESRFSVLVGPAGTGKTAMLGILCTKDDQGAIHNDDLLLLAPTGKARVLMQQQVKGVRAQTIAQFLNPYGHYDGKSGRYLLNPNCSNCAKDYRTVIVDEASMLTEDMLGALLNAMHKVERLILVGDPAQLPPIGAGRPFVDIIAELRRRKADGREQGYAELAIGHRQTESQGNDMSFARWFGTSAPLSCDDIAFTDGDIDEQRLQFVNWETEEGFREKLMEVLAEELNMRDDRSFNQSLGCHSKGQWDYFNRGQAVDDIENWQILSPLRGMSYGVNDINRQIHQRFRAKLLEYSKRNYDIPKPMGAEQIIYGDKVINQKNQTGRPRQRVEEPYERDKGYLANGEIGIVVGQWSKKRPQNTLKVEFASQKGYTYDFRKGDFGLESDALLELAYALTVHRAQGSQFSKVILVLPEDHQIISRELLYTALTRHQERVVIMHQGPVSRLKELSSWSYSETARRRTNLFTDCKMLEFRQGQNKVFMQEGLIHRTGNGLAVRSKAELSIAQALENFGIEFEYEEPLKLENGIRYPDFTIENEFSGKKIYWEHLGMLDVENYRQAWEKKRKWYIRNGILPVEDKNAKDHVLVTTDDKKGLDMVEIERLIKELCGI